MSVLVNVCLHWKDTQLNYHAVNLISQETIASQAVSTELQGYGMSAQVNALRLSVDTTMKYWMRALIAPATN